MIETGIIYVSKNGRWVVTRGKTSPDGVEVRYRVQDKEGKTTTRIVSTGGMMKGHDTVPPYVIAEIAKDINLVAAVADMREGV